MSVFAKDIYAKEIDIPASQYVADGYTPPLDELPYA